MSKKAVAIIVLSILCSFESYGQTYFQKHYGADTPEFFTEGQPTDDGGFIVAGARKTSGSGQWRTLACKIDADGHIIWSKTFQGSDDQSATSMKKTLDGHFILAGRSKSFAAGEQDVFLMKIDEEGNVLWGKTYGGPGNEWINTRVVATSDGGYIVSAYSDGYGAGSIDCYMVKTDGQGEIEWTRTIGGEGYDYCSQVIELSSGGYAMTGFTTSIGQGGYDGLLSKIDVAGDTLWAKSYGKEGDQIENIYGVTETSDGGFMMVGRSYQSGVNYQCVLIKTDASGNALWAKEMGGSGNDYFTGITYVGGGEYLINGRGNSFTANYDGFILKINEQGDVLWTKNYGDPEFTSGIHLTHLADGGNLIVGRIANWPDDLGYVIRTDSLGNSGCFESEVTFSVSDYPIIVSNGLVLGSGGVANNAPYLSLEHPLPELNLCTTECFMELEISGTDLNCFNDSSGTATVEVEEGLMPYDVSWSNGEQTLMIDGLDANQYNVIVIDSAGCTREDSLVIAQPDMLQVVGTITHVSNDGAGEIFIEISGGTPEYTISWNTGSSEELITNLFPDDYEVSISDENNCMVSANYVVLDSTTNSISEFDIENFMYFPNPTKDFVQFNVESQQHLNHSKLTMQFFTIKGDLVMNMNAKAENRFFFDRTNLLSGTYIFTLYYRDSKIGSGQIILE